MSYNLQLKPLKPKIHFEDLRSGDWFLHGGISTHTSLYMKVDDEFAIDFGSEDSKHIKPTVVVFTSEIELDKVVTVTRSDIHFDIQEREFVRS